MNVNKSDTVLVVMGGPSTEAEVSRRTGGAIANALTTAGYRIETMEFEPRTFLTDMERIQPRVVFNALHGKYGEDGAIQNLLEMLQVPYTGSGPIASAITMDKVISKRLLLQAGLPTADATVYMKHQDVSEIVADVLQKFAFPVVIKAANQGSTIGISIVRNKAELDVAIETCRSYGTWILAERFLSGREFTVAVLNGEVLPVIEVIPHSGTYDYKSKYTKGATDYLVPAPISEALTEEMSRLAKDAYGVMGCAGVARVDFMTDEAERPFILELNTVPGMTETSLVPKAANAVGINFTELCEKILMTASDNKL